MRAIITYSRVLAIHKEKKKPPGKIYKARVIMALVYNVFLKTNIHGTHYFLLNVEVQ